MQANKRKDTPEHTALKIKARAMGLKFGPRLSEPKLQKLVDDYIRDTTSTQPETPVEEAPEGPKPAVIAPPPPPKATPKFKPSDVMSAAEFKVKQTQQNRLNAGRLVRIRLTCMNPQKKNWTGEIVSVGSAAVGTYKKFVPFNSEEPYHVPHIIYQHLKERQCRIGTVIKLPNGREVNRNKLINEFAIEVLPPLTKQELTDLAQRQAMAAGTV